MLKYFILARLLFVASMFALLFSCGKEKPDNTGDNKSDEGSEYVEIKLPTIQCSMCKKTIETALAKSGGISKAEVNVKGKTAAVRFDKSKTNIEKIEGVISLAGYQANDLAADTAAYNNLNECCKIGGH